MRTRIYLDNNASTPLDPLVAEEIRLRLSDLQGNPSSSHAFGQKMRSIITKCRDGIAAALKIKASEIVFTSCGTEGINMLIRGIAGRKPKGHIVTSLAEHSCVIGTCKLLEAEGYTVTYLPIGSTGSAAPEAVRGVLTPDTCLIALMAVNNETGVKTEIDAIASIALERKIPFVVDAVSQIGKEPIVPTHEGITAIAYSGHKFHALQGAGFVFIRSGCKIHPLFVGGEQEHGRRAGTENVLGIVSMAKALECFVEDEKRHVEHLALLRDTFEKRLLANIENVSVNGEGKRTSNVSNLAFMGVDGETLLMMLDGEGVSASHGSACSSGALEPSRVLTAMGLPGERVGSSIRFSFSRLNTLKEVEQACGIIEAIVAKLREKRH